MRAARSKPVVGQAATVVDQHFAVFHGDADHFAKQHTYVRLAAQNAAHRTD